MDSLFKSEFEGMSKIDFTYNDFEETREKLINEVNNKITSEDKAFLLSFFQGTPQWDSFPHEIAKDLPAIKWKLQNIEKMSPNKKAQQVKLLEELF